MKEKKIAYSVGEMAEYFGVSRDTLRLYDKMGILSPKKNEDNGYRVYSRADFICLDYVMRLKSLGMSLEDINRRRKLHHDAEGNAGSRGLCILREGRPIRL